MATKQMKVNYRSTEYATQCQKDKNEILNNINIKDNLISEEVLSKMVDNIEEVKIVFGAEKIVGKNSYSNISIHFDGKKYNNPCLKLKNSKYMKYHIQYGNGCLMIKTSLEHEKNIFTLFLHILNKIKEQYADVKEHYIGISEKYNIFKVQLPQHTTKDAKKKLMYDFCVFDTDSEESYYKVVDPKWEDDDSDNTGVKELCSIFDGKSVINSYVNISLIYKGNDIVSLKPKSIYMVVKKQKQENLVAELI